MHSNEPRDLLCRRFRVTGRVQGVFFRASTRDVARELDLKGYAMNLRDGSVEVLACGNPSAIDALAEWLERGPPLATVERVDAVDCPYEEHRSFETA